MHGFDLGEKGEFGILRIGWIRMSNVLGICFYPHINQSGTNTFI
jgi:hypothetical protein